MIKLPDKITLVYLDDTLIHTQPDLLTQQQIKGFCDLYTARFKDMNEGGRYILYHFYTGDSTPTLKGYGHGV